MKKYITQLGVITLLIFLFLGATSISVLAQHAHPPKDPYNKPDIWLKIEQSPHEIALWTEYMGKSWQELSYNERLKVKMWIQDMWLNQLSTKNAVIAVVEEEKEVVEKTIVKKEEKEIKEEVAENVVVKKELVEQKEDLVKTVVEAVKEKEEKEIKGEFAENVVVKKEVVEQKEDLVQTVVEQKAKTVVKVEQKTKADADRRAHV